MTERVASIPDRLTTIRRFVLSARKETPDERNRELNSFYKQMSQAAYGSQRYDMAFAAYRGLQRQQERTILVVFGKDTPIWF